MSAPQIQDYLKYANLQMAAEALYDFDATKKSITPDDKYTGDLLARYLTTGNLHASRFTQLEAEKLAKDWFVVEHISNTKTGFSGTLFKNRFTDELVLSFRSTEFIDDAARDNEATNKLEIQEKGFAFGQLADMEDWYASLKANGKILSGQKVDVTGYSLGGHLATAFNLMHQNEVKQVVTFNGAGVGRIEGGIQNLATMVEKFNTLRKQSNLEALMQSDFGKDTYAALKQALTLKGSILASEVQAAISNARTLLGSDTYINDFAAQTDIDLLGKAIDRAQSVANEALRVNKELKSGATVNNGEPDTPALVAESSIDAAKLDYQLAVLQTASQYKTTALSISASLDNARIQKTYDPALKLTNQYDVVGTETTSTPLALVANSQVHYGNDTHFFIEDQPLFRGGSVLSATLTSLVNAGVKLLVNGYDKTDFGDTHSLVLLVDSLNVQNTLLQLVKWTTEDERIEAATTLNQILKAASYREMQNGDMAIGSGQGKAEGDVLENTLNALADLVLGPQAAKDKRLKGSLDGNTWAKDSKDLGPYTGRDTFYKTLDDILKSDAFKSGGLLGKLSLKVANADLAGAAHNDFGAFAALYSLSPFVFSFDGLDDTTRQKVTNAWGGVYDDWNADQQAIADGRSERYISDTWIADRAAFAERKEWFNTANKNPLNPARDASTPYDQEEKYFEDKTSDYIVAQGTVGNATSHYIFGDEKGGTLSGKGSNDHIYGGSGIDILNGLYGEDWLEGSDGDDTLTGGKGQDMLIGGKGNDRYVFAADDGSDVIVDRDGKGSIEINGEILNSAYLLDGSSELWGTEDDKYIFKKLPQSDGSTTLMIMVKGSGDRITIQNFSSGIQSGGQLGLMMANAESVGGSLGIELLDSKTPNPVSRTEFYGDREPEPDPSGDFDYLDDVLGNIVPTGRPAPGMNDQLLGDGGNNRLVGGGGNDILYARNGDDLLEGGDGVDILSGGEGKDILKGGAGDDYLLGSGTYMSLRWRKDTPYKPPQGVNIIAAGRNWSIYEDAPIDDEPVFNIHGTNGGEVPDSGNQLFGGDGNDKICSGNADDYAFGEAGDDAVWGMRGNDVVDGGAGNDLLEGGGGAVILKWGSYETYPVENQIQWRSAA